MKLPIKGQEDKSLSLEEWREETKKFIERTYPNRTGRRLEKEEVDYVVHWTPIGPIHYSDTI